MSSVLSVGHCEGRGGRWRVGLGLKGAGSWEIPVTILRNRKDGVVQRAARICHRNLLFAKSLYRSSAACIPYSLPNPPSGPSTGPKIRSVVVWEHQWKGKCVWKKMRMTTDLSNTRELRGCQTVRFAVSQALCTQTPRKQRPLLARYSFKTMWFKTSHVVVSESKNNFFISNLGILFCPTLYKQINWEMPRLVGLSLIICMFFV